MTRREPRTRRGDRRGARERPWGQCWRCWWGGDVSRNLIRQRRESRRRSSRRRRRGLPPPVLFFSVTMLAHAWRSSIRHSSSLGPVTVRRSWQTAPRCSGSCWRGCWPVTTSGIGGDGQVHDLWVSVLANGAAGKDRRSRKLPPRTRKRPGGRLRGDQSTALSRQPGPMLAAGSAERGRPESNRCRWLCRPPRNHSATAPTAGHRNGRAGDRERYRCDPFATLSGGSGRKTALKAVSRRGLFGSQRLCRPLRSHSAKAPGDR